jgi:hypothetical protein
MILRSVFRLKKERIFGGELQVKIVDVELQVRIVDVELQARIVDGKGQVWTKHF